MSKRNSNKKKYKLDKISNDFYKPRISNKKIILRKAAMVTALSFPIILLGLGVFYWMEPELDPFYDSFGGGDSAGGDDFTGSDDSTGTGEEDTIAEGESLILIHGWSSSSSTWDVIMNNQSFIDLYGAENMTAIDYYDDNTDEPEFDGVDGDTHIIEVAERLCDYIIKLKNEGIMNGHLDILAHSMGGLVARSLIKFHYPELRANGMMVEHVATLATPNHGTIGAYYWGFGGAQTEDMDPGFSSLLPILNDETNGGMTPYSISDNLIYTDITYSTYWGWLDIVVGEHDDVYIDDVDCVNFDYVWEDHGSVLETPEVLTDLLDQIILAN